MLILRTVAQQFTIYVFCEIQVLQELWHPCWHENHMIRALLTMLKTVGPGLTSVARNPQFNFTIDNTLEHTTTSYSTLQHRGWRRTWPATAGCRMAHLKTLNGAIVPGRAPEYLAFVPDTTCTMFTIVAISLCANSPFGSWTFWGCDAWNLVPTYFARNLSRYTKLGHSPSHSELVPTSEFTVFGALDDFTSFENWFCCMHNARMTITLMSLKFRTLYVIQKHSYVIWAPL